ncbi:unnamed protein product [Vitrella brassicaformis CCMP3155]|uniref:Uncharacterized protein n=1 Tax=Vitrella brassicaformis (strain CCMP3155) TaxID=1169540 RepID=A0A0G4GLW6_VITBC|nr:unnamed protein product [Vitrella brassicaformis CCMP3155]|eukprot:CEM31118.1 unnamed protein product [Vitrella brassicaformis CCMP3155]
MESLSDDVRRIVAQLTPVETLPALRSPSRSLAILVDARFLSSRLDKALRRTGASLFFAYDELRGDSGALLGLIRVFEQRYGDWRRWEAMVCTAAHLKTITGVPIQLTRQDIVSARLGQLKHHPEAVAQYMLISAHLTPRGSLRLQQSTEGEMTYAMGGGGSRTTVTMTLHLSGAGDAANPPTTVGDRDSYRCFTDAVLGETLLAPHDGNERSVGKANVPLPLPAHVLDSCRHVSISQAGFSKRVLGLSGWRMGDAQLTYAIVFTSGLVMVFTTEGGMMAAAKGRVREVFGPSMARALIGGGEGDS